ncbi:MAG: regulatory protein NosR [Geminicoccaceae bacterium]|nr:regulatory protein NosR [Geminicoccaceae bacterium]
MLRLSRLLLGLLLAVLATAAPALAAGDLARFLDDVTPGELVPGADAFGPVREDLPIVPVLEGGTTVGHAFVNTDFVGAVGYSGKPIHVVLALDDDAKITGLKLVKHYEPIVLIGIPEAKITRVIDGYVGLDMAREVEETGEGHDLDIVSGATVTIMVIDDSIVRSGIKVARLLGLGGLEAEAAAPVATRALDTQAEPRTEDWLTLLGDGSIRRLTLDVGMVNEAFERSGDAEAAARPEPGPPDATFIDLYTGLLTVPTIGRSVLGANEWHNLESRLKEGGHAIFVGGRGIFSFKGSGYVRGGIFDRIQLIQGDTAIRFRDRQHKRLSRPAAEGAPRLDEFSIFTIPADSGFDPTRPWHLQLLVQRATGATSKAFLTFDLNYEVPDAYLVETAPARPAAAAIPVGASPVGEASFSDEAREALWQKVWAARTIDIVVVGAAIVLLTLLFFFQMQAVRHARFLFWGRIVFLCFTLFWLGWYAKAQLSVVNIMTFTNSLLSDFSWDYFLMDPLIFMLWFSVAAALLFWGRGAYCGWLCPFGALQELTNRVAKFLRIPQWHVPWGLHERLWPLKYMIFLVLFGVSLYSLDTAEHLAEIEPFKTAIILHFIRDWPFVVFAVALLVAGLFVERFYCRYLCALGAGLAIPGRVRMFDWLKRYRECGNPCQICANECPVQSIHPEGNINPNECIQCLHCQVLYKDDKKCPVCVKARLKRERQKARSGDSARPVLPPRPVSANRQPREEFEA